MPQCYQLQVPRSSFCSNCPAKRNGLRDHSSQGGRNCGNTWRTCPGKWASNNPGVGICRAASQESAWKAAQNQRLVLEVEEAEDPENRGRSTAEPAQDAAQWMISEDHEQK